MGGSGERSFSLVRAAHSGSPHALGGAASSSLAHATMVAPERLSGSYSPAPALARHKTSPPHLPTPVHTRRRGKPPIAATTARAAGTARGSRGAAFALGARRTRSQRPAPPHHYPHTGGGASRDGELPRVSLNDFSARR